MAKRYLQTRTRRRSRTEQIESCNPGDIYQTLIEVLPDAVLISCDQKIVYVNPACLSLLAADKPEQLIGKNIAEMLPNEMVVISEGIEDQRALLPIEHVLRAVDGSLVEIEAVAVPCQWNGYPAIEVVLRDIRERKRVEKAAEHWQKRLELAQQSGLKIGWWDWDVTAQTVVWSDETCRQFGYPPGTFSGQLQEAVGRIHPEDRVRVEEALQKVVQGGGDYAVQYRVLRPDGSICWIDARGVVVRKGSARMIGVGIDITDFKAAEQTLQESEEKYRMLLDSTAEGIYGVDLNGICTFCNPAAARMLGYENPGQLFGRSVHLAHHYRRPDGSAYPESNCSICGSLQGKGAQIENESLYRLDGTRFLVDCWSFPLMRESQIVGSVVTFLDITERAKAEKQLRESESNFRSIVEHAPYGIYRATVEGQLTLANPALVTMLGCESEQEVLSLNIERDVYAHPEQRSPLVAESLKNGYVRNAEIEWNRKDGSLMVVRANGVPVFDETSRLEGFQVFVEDVTESKNLERRFWQAQKLEAVGRLAGGVAHDFNNVLMIISSYADLILQRNLPDEKSIAYAQQIRQAALRASRVTQQLLAFSRKQILEPELLDPSMVLKDLGKVLPNLLGENIAIAIHSDPEVHVVKVDRGQLEQIIMNLSVNARDAMPNGGRLTIRTVNVELDIAFAADHPPITPGSYVLLSVSDTGNGMDAGTKARIFEPFFTKKERGKGTGLGLAAVYGIVKQSGGFIWLNSELGKGTTFDIYLPRLDERLQDSLKPCVAEPKLFGSERILLVEDEEQVLIPVREFLERSGYFVLSATNGADALRVVDSQSGDIDLLLTDLVMPGLDGVQVARSIRSKYPNVRVLYISGYADPQGKGLDKAAALLRKPFSQQLLASKIREVLTSPV